MDDIVDNYQFVVTQFDNESTSPDLTFNMENCRLEKSSINENSLSTVQNIVDSPSMASNSVHQPLGPSLPQVELSIRTIRRQLTQSRPKSPRRNTEHSDSHTPVTLTRNPSLSPQEPSSFPLEYPAYPTNDVNFDEWTDYTAYCGTAPEPELLNLLSNEDNASLDKNYFTPRSVDDVNSENSSSCANKVTMRLRTHDFEVTTAQPTNSISLIDEL
ncbi:hypothetical protein EAE96_009747 [Botrytis aclada]|nr:hypothetical protein EAE96_009747 [Botrytis aclada]